MIIQGFGLLQVEDDKNNRKYEYNTIEENINMISATESLKNAITDNFIKNPVNGGNPAKLRTRIGLTLIKNRGAEIKM